MDQCKFLERGGALTFGRIKKKAITDKSGKIVAVKGVSVTNPTEVFQEIVSIIDPDSRPMDQVKLIQEVIDREAGLENEVKISLRLRPSTEGGFNLIWEKESNVGLENDLVSNPVPDDVLEKLKSEFHILV